MQSVCVRRDRCAGGDEVFGQCSATLGNCSRQRARGGAVETEGLVDNTVHKRGALELLREQLWAECRHFLLEGSLELWSFEDSPDQVCQSHGCRIGTGDDEVGGFLSDLGLVN